MRQLTTEEYLYIITHLKSDDDIPHIYNYLLEKKFFEKTWDELNDDEKIEVATQINLMCNEECSQEELLLLAISKNYGIPFNQVKELPSSIGRFLLNNMKDKLQPKKEEKKTMSLTDLILQKKQTSEKAFGKAPDEEILKIFEKNFGKDCIKQ